MAPTGVDEVQAGGFRFLGFVGSLRTGSYNGFLMRAAGEVLPAGATLAVARIDDVPHYNADLEADGFPPSVVRLRAQVLAADALVFSTPEYNFSVPGVLKNAIDWISRPPDQPFAGKPAAIIGTARSQMGTSRAQYHLRHILVSLDVHALNRPEVTMTRAPERFASDGTMDDPPTRERLEALMGALAEWTRRLAR